MFALVEIGGHQFKVSSNDEIFVYKLDGKEGDKITFDKVLLVSDAAGTKVGTPKVDGVVVSATIVEQLKDDKVIVFKKKRRKGFKVKNGFRQSLTKIKIDSIA
ncbi:MAG: 50S ribosomal protein L21 [Chitinophagales bacterium]|nr:50S ribosomal protein L21 [Chitinophagales bacterium]HMV03036.1 50S ribosomal protein L21 [Chitinophagales bacterium]HNB39705.1 50S ribosomal protein L21 [Chitinophagales bacterium]